MKFLCPNCKAKYQISDEKIAGRTLKMDCRRCNHPIVIRGDRAQQRSRSSSTSSVSRQRQSYASPAPGIRSSGRGSLGADFRKNAGAVPPPPKPSALDKWHISINDVPVGPMQRSEVANKIGAGAVHKSSLCWREGFDDWRELRNVPELAALLRRAAPPTTPKKAAFPPPPGRALGARAPVRVVRPPAASRPAASRPAARGNVVPIGGRLGGGAAPALDELPDEFLDDEPTRVGTEYDFAKIEAEQRRIDEDRRRAAEAAEADEAQQREEAARAAEEASREEKQKVAIGLAPTAEIAHSDAFDPFASQAGQVPVAPAVSQPQLEPPLPAESMPVALEAIPARRQRAIPIGAWIAIAGAMSFGMVLAIMVGTRYLTQPPPVAAVPTPAPEISPSQALPELVTEVPPAPIDPAELPPDPGDPAEEQPVQGGQEGRPVPSTGSGRRRGTTTGGGGAGGGGGGGSRRGGPALTAAQRAALARAAGGGDSTAPLQIRSDTPLEQDRRRGGGTSLNVAQIRAVVNRERSGVTRCYETAVRQAGSAPSMRINVDVTISGSGIVTRARARGQSFGNITDCIERTVRRWHFPRTGAESRTSLPFVFQGRDG